jgi:hypothetical protein
MIGSIMLRFGNCVDAAGSGKKRGGVAVESSPRGENILALSPSQYGPIAIIGGARENRVTSHEIKRRQRAALLSGSAWLSLLAIPALVPLGVVLAMPAMATPVQLPSSTTTIDLSSYAGSDFSVATGVVISTFGANAVYGAPGPPFTLTNDGTITSDNSGIVFSRGGTILNTGLISSTYSAISMQVAAGTVTNTGTIISNTTGAVGLLSGGLVSNGVANTGTQAYIHGANFGVSIAGGGTILNFGTIVAGRLAFAEHRGGLNAAGSVGERRGQAACS